MLVLRSPQTKRIQVVAALSFSHSSSCLELNHPVVARICQLRSPEDTNHPSNSSHPSIFRKQKKLTCWSSPCTARGTRTPCSGWGRPSSVDLVIAVAAQVVYRARRVFEAAARGLEACVDGACGAAAGAAEIGLAGASRGGLVLFAGHCGVCLCWRRGWVGGFVVRWAGWRWNLNFLLSARESGSRILKQATLLGSARECSGRCRGRGEGFHASSC